jgi:hypothetical protein
MADTGYSNFFLQYWFVIIILGIGLLAIIVFNLVIYFVFSKKKPVDPNTILSELDELENEKKSKKSKKSFADIRSDSLSPGSGLLNNDLNKFQNEALGYHNFYRKKHASPPLTLDDTLSGFAQYWAEELTKMANPVHSPMNWRKKYNGEPLGENIFVSKNQITGKSLSEVWYSEVNKHDFSQSLQNETQSFTQMIWFDTKKVGFGKAYGPNGRCVVVALYYPMGNIQNEFENNVYEPEDTL